jgi:hypothetical protein
LLHLEHLETPVPWTTLPTQMEACRPSGYPLSQMVYHSRAAIIWWKWCQHFFVKRSGTEATVDILAEKSASNQFEIYNDTYWPTRRGNGRLHCYYLCDPDGNECVNHPPVEMAWYDTVPQLDN